MMVSLVSAKGSPGATTTALCLAAAAGDATLMVEADPSGGDLACWTGPHPADGLVGLATRLRPGLTAGEIREHAAEVAPGIRAVTAPTTEPAMAAVLAMSAQLGPTLASAGCPIVVDRGRWSSHHPDDGLAAASDIVLTVCRPTLDSIEHTRGLLVPAGHLDGLDALVAVVLVGGDRPYGPHEVATALGYPVIGVLPWDPRGAIALIEHGIGRTWRRTALAAATEELGAAVFTNSTAATSA